MSFSWKRGLWLVEERCWGSGHGFDTLIKGIRQRAILKLLGKENVSDGARPRNENEFDIAFFQGWPKFKYLIFLGSNYCLWLVRKEPQAQRV